ncbi:MAG: hypothetical protein K6C38_00755 [Saccharofermentans sp.]|nr:hypothetical protein [Saccharofermentans sp.]
MLKYKLVRSDGDVLVYEYWDPTDERTHGVVSYNIKSQEMTILFLPEWDKYRMFLGHMVRVIRREISKGINIDQGSCAWY